MLMSFPCVDALVTDKPLLTPFTAPGALRCLKQEQNRIQTTVCTNKFTVGSHAKSLTATINSFPVKNASKETKSYMLSCTVLKNKK